MENAEKHLKDFFKSLRRVKSNWESILSQVDRPLTALRNKTEQLQLVSCDHSDEDFISQFPGIKDRLNAKIVCSIEEEMALLRKSCEHLRLCMEELREKNLAIEHSYHKMSPTELEEEFNPLRPSFSDLLEYSLNAYRLYQASLVLIQYSLDSVNYLDNESVLNIERAFLEDNDKKEHVQYILALTQLYEES